MKRKAILKKKNTHKKKTKKKQLKLSPCRRYHFLYFSRMLKMKNQNAYEHRVILGTGNLTIYHKWPPLLYKKVSNFKAILWERC